MIVGAFGCALPVNLLACLGIVTLFAVTIASASFALALRIKREHTVSAVVNAVMIPVLLLSGTLVPITNVLAPGWLYTLSRLNPVPHVMDAARAAFRGDLGLADTGTGLVVLLIMAAPSSWWGMRTFAAEAA